MGGQSTHGYPCTPYWSPAYSYGTQYGTGLYSHTNYYPIAPPPPVPPPAYSHSRIVQTSTMATPNFVTPQQTMYPVPYPNIPQVPTFTPAPGIPPAMSNFYQPPLPVVAPVPMATVLPVTAASPAVVPSIPNHIVAPTSVLGNGGFRSGGFNLFGDTDTTTTVVQSRVGIVTGSAQVL